MFEVFSKAVYARFQEMSERELYVVEVPDIFEKYLSFYPEGTNPIYRQRTVHDCQCCKHFVRRIGGLVNIVDGMVQTVWANLDLNTDLPEPYKSVADKMDALVRQFNVKTVFRTKERKYSTAYNYDTHNNERHDHFYCEIADKHYSREPDTKRGEIEAIYQVFKRGLCDVSLPHVDDVLDLINSNGLYRGEEHKDAVIEFKKLVVRYESNDTDRQGDLFVWENIHNKYARFRNTVIGSLFVDLSEGKDLEQAVKLFETKVAPQNYKRPTAIITQKMVETAVETLNNLGLGAAIYRRFARMSDVSVNDVLFVDNDTKGQMKDGVSLLLESCVIPTTIDVKKATPIGVDDFLKNVLPSARSISLMLENRHTGNFVSLTAPDHPGVKRLFKWNNDFAWSYDGDVTDSVKQRVKAAGGRIDCKMRVSLSWFNFDDLDLHAITPPRGERIYYGNKKDVLDVDMNAGGRDSRNAVENLAFNDLIDGVYTIEVHQFQQREDIDVGFSIEVECSGILQQHNYAKRVKPKECVECFKLHVKGGELIKVETNLPGGVASMEKWGVKTQSLVPVAAVMNSPNHWGGDGVGARHLIFALKNCKNPGSTRGIYNEFLRSDLDKHRKVFEVLGSKTKCKLADEQISGVGFTNARGDTVTVLVNGGRSYTISF